MSDSSNFIYSRSFLVDDTWVLLLVFTAAAVSFLNLGFMITGKRKRWNRSGNRHPEDRGTGRGPHRMSWKLIYATQFVSFFLTSIAQFFSVTEDGVCSIDAVTFEKTCNARSSVTAFLYYINLFFMATYVATFITHAKDFLWAIALRTIVIAVSVTQFGLYISVGSVPAAIFQGIAIALDVFNIYLSWSGRKQSFLRIERRIVDAARDIDDVPLFRDGEDDDMLVSATSSSREHRPRRHNNKRRSSRNKRRYAEV